MSEVLTRALREHAALSIVGMCKNAGKTTVLNRLIALSREDSHALALTSVGRDGEDTDVVTGTEKPGIWVHAGTLVATAADMLRLCDITREILYTTGMYTPLGEVVVVRALSDGFVQLAGPSMNDQLAALGGLLRALGAKRLLIDGALSRKTLCAPSVCDAAILCTGASCHPDLDTVVADTAHACRLLSLPQAQGENLRRHEIPGAVTDALLKKLDPKAGDEITVPDGSHMLLSRALFERLLARGVTFSAHRTVHLCCVCVNPYSARGVDFDPLALRTRMAEAVSVPVLNVKEEVLHGNQL